MKKTFKIKETDIQKIVTKIIKENETLDEYMALMGDEGEDMEDADPNTPGVQVELTLAKNYQTGDVYILKDAFSEEPEILGIVNASGEVKKAA
jgi:hypothetical protein